MRVIRRPRPVPWQEAVMVRVKASQLKSSPPNRPGSYWRRWSESSSTVTRAILRSGAAREHGTGSPIDVDQGYTGQDHCGRQQHADGDGLVQDGPTQKDGDNRVDVGVGAGLGDGRHSQ